MPRIYRKGVKIMKTMIYLEEDIHNRLKHLAVDERLSMAELIRRAVDEYLKKYPKKGGGKR
jgi:predicted transcriptional regulator